MSQAPRLGGLGCPRVAACRAGVGKSPIKGRAGLLWPGLPPRPLRQWDGDGRGPVTKAEGRGAGGAGLRALSKPGRGRHTAVGRPGGPTEGGR